ncbi:cobyrinate a,c-diamide synthase [Kribbella solani]|uniref:cobyrinate a,c-diamide synthase n=1 Tax=Kribbella solani TaxID=236067 RepID=UPI0029A18D48|nr:cobyrinate a,c-diamide synthase [Kribbella solani]MDX2971824.1 cobyrinate a,c-diamide synthase [Kribbella solani]MDX3000463.1 cobyrinate a,c-diamide synthase [Kribbella solani]
MGRLIPRVVVAAPASGAGKTTVAVGLMAALRRAGHTVAGFKVGPDYIDPGFHAVATGRPGRNLDPMLSGEERVAPLFQHGAAGADLAVVEGVMGLYDGALGTEGFSSTAHVAKLLRAPVVLVVDASAAGRSVGAVVQGFVAYDPEVRIVGVILNKVGSERHETEVRAGVAPTGVPVLGVLRRDARLTVPSRHLGLVPAPEQQAQAEQAVAAAAELVHQGVDLQSVVTAAHAAPHHNATPWNPTAAVLPKPVWGAPPPDLGGQPAPKRFGEDHLSIQGGRTPQTGLGRGGRPVVAVAGGPVFSFRYTETTELLEAAGAEVITFDPLTDQLPEATAGLYLGGGFPELHAEALSANTKLRDQVAAEISVGLPVIAECAGLLYLCRELDGHPMTGVLPATARMTSRLTLGYRTAVAATTTAFYDEGRRVRGHEFHRTTITPSTKELTPAWYLPAGAEGMTLPHVHASYLHVHWTATPDVPVRFVAAARSR